MRGCCFLIGLLALMGCSRLHFRERADTEVQGLLKQKDQFPDWRIEQWHIYPDARARFADPADPDFPPYPPDDYPTWLLSPNPQRPGKPGTGKHEGIDYLQWIEQWDALNRAAEASETSLMDGPSSAATPSAGPSSAATPSAGPSSAATPGAGQSSAATPSAGPSAGTSSATSPSAGVPTDLSQEYLAALRVDQRPYRITLDQAVELALFNSREFQDRREDLYLAALPVTNERFSFAAQAFASSQTVREWSGSARPDAGNRWRLENTAGLSRLFPTGGLLLFRFANEVVVNLTSPRPDVSFSNLSLSLVQPLLAGGGYAVTLEALTQAERTLLYAIRSYARFRKLFYAAIAVAGDYTNNPYGLAGLAVNLGRGVGVNFTAPSVGYLPTVLRAAILSNERKNIRALEQQLQLIKNLKEGGNSTQLQVIQAEQQLLTSLTEFLTNTRLYQDQLDNFKLQLGVPTTLPLELDDAPLRPMRLQLQRYDALYAQLAQFQIEAARFEPDDTVETTRERWRRLLADSDLVRGTPFAQEYPSVAARLEAESEDDLARREQALQAELQQLLDAAVERLVQGLPETADAERQRITVETALELIQFERAVREYGQRRWLRAAPERQAVEQANAYRKVSDSGTLLGIRARNQRNDAIRADWPQLPAVVLAEQDLLAMPLDEALMQSAQTALNLRLDLMNSRAQLVDAYRQIAIRANALLGVLNVRYDYSTDSPADGSDAGALGGGRSRNSVALRYEPPFVRRIERNLYRASLIAYQRQRRFLMAVEDNIVNDVRSEVRHLRALAQTYRLQARAVELAYAQVDAARSTLVAPPDPAARESAGNIAALTDQLLRAQAQLLRSQNALYTTWVNFQAVRTNLYLDLELLPLDDRGLWIDDPAAAGTQTSLQP